MTNLNVCLSLQAEARKVRVTSKMFERKRWQDIQSYIKYNIQFQMMRYVLKCRRLVVAFNESNLQHFCKTFHLLNLLEPRDYPTLITILNFLNDKINGDGPDTDIGCPFRERLRP